MTKLKWLKRTGHVTVNSQTDGKCGKLLVRKSEAKKPLERLRLLMEDNIKMYLKELGFRGVV
jgi:hypothetical protein